MSQDDYLGTALSVTVVDDGYKRDFRRGPWGQRLAWDPATQSYSREVRPPRPPLNSQPMAPLPEPEEVRMTDPPHVARHGHEPLWGKNSAGHRLCMECRRETVIR